MNERIQELAKESGLIQYDSDGKIQDVEKFAKLIVKECIDIVPWQYEEKIRRHFGVE